MKKSQQDAKVCKKKRNSHNEDHADAHKHRPPNIHTTQKVSMMVKAFKDYDQDVRINILVICNCALQKIQNIFKLHGDQIQPIAASCQITQCMIVIAKSVAQVSEFVNNTDHLLLDDLGHFTRFNVTTFLKLQCLLQLTGVMFLLHRNILTFGMKDLIVDSPRVKKC